VQAEGFMQINLFKSNTYSSALSVILWHAVTRFKNQ